MNKNNTLLNIISIVFLLACTTLYAEIKAINFAVMLPHAPFASLNAHGPFYGFDIDIAKAICNKLKVQYVFHSDTMTNIDESLKTGKYDAWIGAIAITKDRKKYLDFSDPYFSDTVSLIATKKSTFSARPIEIKGKTIGVNIGTIYIDYIKNIYGDNVKIKVFPRELTSISVLTPEALIALKNGEVDAVIDDKKALTYWHSMQKDGKRYRLINLPAKNLDLIHQKFGIAVAKGNIKLLEEINKALAEIKADGTYNEIVKKHFET